MNERKTEAINLRMSPSTKELLRLAAEADRRTLSNMLEVLILDHCKRRGIRADERRSAQGNIGREAKSR
jgi:hypothetical protein